MDPIPAENAKEALSLIGESTEAELWVENPPAVAERERPANSYGQILHSSVITGAATGVTVLMAMARTKANAVLLGPAGIGLFGLFNSILEIASKLGTLGILNSGVRQIAEAVGTDDQIRVAQTVTALQRLTLILGSGAAALLFLLRGPISQLTFGTPAYGREIGFLGLFLLFDTVAGGQCTILQGMRRVGLLARRNIAGSVLGAAVSVTLIYWLRERGIAPGIVSVSVAMLLCSWWYARKVRLPKANLDWMGFWQQSRQILALGVVFMATGFMFAFVGYLNRWIVSHRFGLEAVGLYQSSTNLSILYPTFILQAMGMDFYPRLTAAAKNDSECNRLVNEQAEIGLLLAVPGILATLSVTPLLITVFYSSHFGPAVAILRWQVLDVFLRMCSMPMLFLLIAKGMGKAMFWVEVVATITYVGFTWICTGLWGLPGAGIGSFAHFLIYTCGMYWLVRSISGFRWSSANVRLGMIFVPALAACLLASFFLPGILAAIVGLAFTVGIGIYNLKMLHKMVGFDNLPFISKIIRGFNRRRA